MYASVCLPVCMYLQYIYIYILNLYICISLSVCPSVCLPSWLAVCLSAFAHLSLFCLCVCLICPSCLIRICLTHLSYVFYLSFIAISILSIYIYYASFLTYCIYRIVISSTFTQFIYLSIDRSPYLHSVLSNPIQPYVSYLSHHAMYISGIYTSHAYSSVGQKVEAQQPDFIFQTSNTPYIVPLGPPWSPLIPFGTFMI